MMTMTIVSAITTSLLYIIPLRQFMMNKNITYDRFDKASGNNRAQT